jgi:hypothetical protein
LTEQISSGDATMVVLSDEERRTLNFLARHPDGCDEAVLLTDGFTVRQLSG